MGVIQKIKRSPNAVFPLARALQLYTWRMAFRIRGTKWFYFTWTLLLFVALGVSLGFMVSNDPKYAFAAVVGIFYFALIITRPFEAFLGWIIFAPFLSKYTVFVSILEFDRVSLGLLLFSTLARKLTKSKGHNRIEAFDVTIGLFLIICLINALTMRPDTGPVASIYNLMFAKDTRSALYVFLDHYLMAVVTFYMVRNLVEDQDQINKLLIAVISLVVYLTPIGIVEHFTGKTWFTRDETLGWSDANRAAGPFINPSVYGAVLGMSLVYALHFVLQTKNWFRRSLYSFAALGACVGEAMTFTRAAWISPLIAYLAMVITYTGGRKRLTIWLAAALIMLLAVAPAIMQTQIFKNRISSKGEVMARLYISHVSINMIKDKPVMGQGIGNFDFYRSKYSESFLGVDKYHSAITSHNTYLTIFAETGVAGFLPYLATFFIIGYKWFRAYMKARRGSVKTRQLLAVLGVSTICYLATAFVIDMRFFKYMEYMFWAVLALICVLCARIQRQTETMPKVHGH